MQKITHRFLILINVLLNEWIVFINHTSNETKNININPCFLSVNFLTRWLCGIGPNCQTFKLTNSSLNRAINNLNKYFDFVGIMEYYEESWKYFLLKYPILANSNSNSKKNKIFGSINIIENGKNIMSQIGFGHVHVGANNPQPSKKSMKKLMKMFELDLKLYNYAKKRFENCVLPLVKKL